MIQINLLPEDLRIKTKTKSQKREATVGPAAFNPEQLFIFALPALVALLILVHLYFAVIWVTQNGQLASLNRKWLASAVQKNSLDEFNQQFSTVSQDARALEQLSRQRILWAQKLNELSLNLPSGVWFNEIEISAKEILIQGSVISLAKEEINLINKLLESLKNNNEFSKDFVSFELSNVQKKNVGGYDIADFMLTGALKVR